MAAGRREGYGGETGGRVAGQWPQRPPLELFGWVECLFSQKFWPYTLNVKKQNLNSSWLTLTFVLSKIYFIKMQFFTMDAIYLSLKCFLIKQQSFLSPIS